MTFDFQNSENNWKKILQPTSQLKETPSQEKEPQKELPEATKLAAQKFKENFFQQIDI